MTNILSRMIRCYRMSPNHVHNLLIPRSHLFSMGNREFKSNFFVFLCYFSDATIRNYYKLSVLKQHNLLVYSSGGQRSQWFSGLKSRSAGKAPGDSMSTPFPRSRGHPYSLVCTVPSLASNSTVAGQVIPVIHH